VLFCFPLNYNTNIQHLWLQIYLPSMRKQYFSITYTEHTTNNGVPFERNYKLMVALLPMVHQIITPCRPICIQNVTFKAKLQLALYYGALQPTYAFYKDFNLWKITLLQSPLQQIILCSITNKLNIVFKEPAVHTPPMWQWKV
jgi:hypothetical protein